MLSPVNRKCFKNLVKDSAKLRIKASLNFLTNVYGSISDQKKDWDDVHSVIEHLVKGLASNKESLRRGHYSTLVGLLSLLPAQCLTFKIFNNIIKKVLDYENNAEKVEEILIGTIFAYGSFISSDAFMRESYGNQKILIDQLLVLSCKEPYLHHLSYSFLIQLLSKISKEDYENIIKAQLNQDIINSKDSLSLDQLHCLFIMKDRFGCKKAWKKLNCKYDFMDESTVQFIINTLMNTTTLPFVDHPVYHVFCMHLISNDETLPIYCSAVDIMLQDSSSHKEFIVLKLLHNLLSNLKNEALHHLPSLMTKNIVNIMLKKKKEHFELIRTNLIQLETCLRPADNEIKLLVINKLLLYPGNLNFDSLTGSKTVHKIINNLDSEGVMRVTNLYYDILCGHICKRDENGLETSWTNKDQLLVAHMYGRIMVHSACYTFIEWRRDQLIKLTEFGFFKLHNNINSENAGIIRTVFFNNLSHRFPRLCDYSDVISAIVKKIDENINNQIALRIKFPAQVSKCWKNALKKSLSLSSKDYKNLPFTKAFHIIILHMAIMLLKEPSSARDCLEELYKILERITVVDKGNDDPHWTEVLVDLFLQLLSKNVSAYRNIVRCVFKYVCTQLTHKALSQILKILDPQFHYKEVDNENGSEMTESDDSDNDTESEGNTFDESKNENDSDKDNDDDSSVEEDNNISKSDKFKMAVGLALNNITANSDNESVDLDDLDEEEGEKLNSVLGDIFKSHNKIFGTSKGQQYEEELTHFRIRVLDMIEIFFDNNPPLIMILEIIPTLFDLLENSIKTKKKEALISKLRGCFSKLSSIKTSSDSDEINFTLLTNELKSLLTSRCKCNPITVAIIPQIVDCFKFFLRIASSKSTSDGSHIFTDILQNELISYFSSKRNNPVVLSLISSAISLCWEGVIILLPNLCSFTFSNDVQIHKRIRAIAVLNTLFKNGRCFNQTVVKTHAKEFIAVKQTVIEGTKEVLMRIVKHDLQQKFDMALFDMLCTLHKYEWFDIKWSAVKKQLTPLEPLFPSIQGDYAKILKRLCQMLELNIPDLDKIQISAETSIGNVSVDSCDHSETNVVQKKKRKQKDKDYSKKKAKVL